MLKRKITQGIENWYKDGTVALLIDGARQVGKTTTIEQFLIDNNIEYTEFNLFNDSLVREAFNKSTNCNQLLLRLTSLTKKEIKEGSVIFIDEIQEAKDALTIIKFLVKEAKFKFIFSGSLLGIKMKDIVSVPVGYLKTISMYPMDFEEFLWANNVSLKTIDYLKDCFYNLIEVDEIVHKQMMSIFNTYLTVGGMPKAVVNFITSNDLNKVNNALEDVDSGYKTDIVKYKEENKLLIQDIYDLIPSELNAQNKRFILKNLNENARFYKYETSFTWLKNSGIGLFVHNVDNPIYPLLASKERTLFKLFLCDVGLLTYKLYNGKQIIVLNGDSTLNFGAIYEDVVAQELNSHGFELYYNSNKKRGEIDFLIEKDNKVIPLEVKSGKDYKRHSALSSLLNDDAFNCEKGYVLCNGNIEKDNKTIYIPIYMIMFFIKTRKKDSQIVKLDISKLI